MPDHEHKPTLLENEVEKALQPYHSMSWISALRAAVAVLVKHILVQDQRIRAVEMHSRARELEDDCK